MIFSNKNHSISIKVDDKLVTPTIEKTFESNYYHKQEEVPMISFKVNKPSKLITTFTF